MKHFDRIIEEFLKKIMEELLLPLVEIRWGLLSCAKWSLCQGGHMSVPHGPHLPQVRMSPAFPCHMVFATYIPMSGCYITELGRILSLIKGSCYVFVLPS